MVMADELHLSKDVAGATLMAAGGSAPELSTSLLTVISTESSAGVGTILGSAVLNMCHVPRPIWAALCLSLRGTSYTAQPPAVLY